MKSQFKRAQIPDPDDKNFNFHGPKALNVPMRSIGGGHCDNHYIPNVHRSAQAPLNKSNDFG